MEKIDYYGTTTCWYVRDNTLILTLKKIVGVQYIESNTAVINNNVNEIFVELVQAISKWKEQHETQPPTNVTTTKCTIV